MHLSCALYLDIRKLLPELLNLSLSTVVSILKLILNLRLCLPHTWT